MITMKSRSFSPSAAFAGSRMKLDERVGKAPQRVLHVWGQGADVQKNAGINHVTALQHDVARVNAEDAAYPVPVGDLQGRPAAHQIFKMIQGQPRPGSQFLIGDAMAVNFLFERLHGLIEITFQTGHTSEKCTGVHFLPPQKCRGCRSQHRV